MSEELDVEENISIPTLLTGSDLMLLELFVIQKVFEWCCPENK